MFSSTVINLVILLAFTYFLASVMISAVNEAILGMLNRRADYLKNTLIRLFKSENDGWKKYINGTLEKEKGFFESTHIRSLFTRRGRKPSYIPFQNFLLTLIEYVGNEKYQKSFEEAIRSSDALNDTVKKSLLDIIAKSKSRISQNINELKAFEEELEQYYNNAMDRATGWYKRETGIVLFVLAIALSVILNIDTIKIINEGLKDPKKLEMAADSISQLVQDNKTGIILLPDGDTIFVSKTLPKETKADSIGNKDSTATPTKEKITKVIKLYNTVSGYQLGYNDGGFCKEWGANFFLKLLGIIITCFALQLGSQFWFDTLNKVANLRATGKKPVENKDEKQ